MKSFKELKEQLPTSSAAQRRKWAEQIVQEDIDVHDLLWLLDEQYPVATRFLWLLSEIGMIQSNRLKKVLPDLFKRSTELKHLPMAASLATYWRICGVPEENESEVLDLLFQWIRSAETNKTTRSRSLAVLKKLCAKYPELNRELQLYLDREGEQFDRSQPSKNMP